jgi:hypothetical protein
MNSPQDLALELTKRGVYCVLNANVHSVVLVRTLVPMPFSETLIVNDRHSTTSVTNVCGQES